MGRPSVSLLDTERITTAALALVADTGGFTIPLLAKKLGVSPSSLYNHVSGREEIVELLRERAMSEVALPGHGLDWRETVAQIARAYRGSYARYPRLIPLLTEHAVNSAHAFGMYNALADALTAAEFGPADVLNIITVLDSFVLGSALDLAAPEAPWRPSVEVGPALRAALDTASSKSSRSDEAFEYGLRALLAGFDPGPQGVFDG
ncbi:TetR/AcrR family transcriptional regulator C-terminal domain-containing protein [Rhodococcus sp. IEGM 1330]|uniref:TetR/AcrR family transcriptional regulator C-terminal domain-containing protein n=1 Tax=Rhodococcus sp. IEGM 1330 TaxID=3082225 RepID=UPI0029545BD3|nr:TetR/AcrR family transcriptional regulator C-terminal domain-containing protein [Rhodococcus sp. IEGM 1330]MDV8021699.1 TetR/AcrR family transcriptional regulator C-terminal domain-containing protein [Rhodococcus sp. IEGM 1330]